MNKLILTTPEELAVIINDCLADFTARNTESQIRKSPPKLLFSIRELAEFLGCSIVTAQKLKNSKKIRFKQFGRKLIFNADEVLEDLNRGKK